MHCIKGKTCEYYCCGIITVGGYIISSNIYTVKGAKSITEYIEIYFRMIHKST